MTAVRVGFALLLFGGFGLFIAAAADAAAVLLHSRSRNPSLMLTIAPEVDAAEETPRQECGLDSTLVDLVDLAAQCHREVADAEERLAIAKASVEVAMRRAKLERFLTPAGNEVLVVKTTSTSWDVDALRKFLKAADLDALLPRRPAASLLNKRCEADPAFATAVREFHARIDFPADPRINIRPAKVK